MAKDNQGDDSTPKKDQNVMQDLEPNITMPPVSDDEFKEVPSDGPGKPVKKEEEAMVQVPVSTMQDMMKRMKSLEAVVLKNGTKASNVVSNDWQELDDSKRVRYAKIAVYHEVDNDEGKLIIDRERLREIRDEKGRAKDSEYMIKLLDRKGVITEKKVTLFQLVAIQQEYTTVAILRTDKKLVYKRGANGGETVRGYVDQDGYRTEGEDVKGAMNPHIPQYEFRHQIKCLVKTNWDQEFEINAERLNLS